MSNDPYDNAIRILTDGVNSTRYLDLIKLMEQVGFQLKKTSRGNHWVFGHESDPSIRSDFDGGHGSNSYVKPVYIRKIIKIMKQIKDTNLRENDE